MGSMPPRQMNDLIFEAVDETGRTLAYWERNYEAPIKWIMVRLQNGSLVLPFSEN